MLRSREDFFPHYREDLVEKARKLREVILKLHQYKIPDLENISEKEYELIRLAVINSIKGEIVAKEEKTRQSFVKEVFLNPAKAQGFLKDYEDTSRIGKCDFEGEFVQGDHFGLEVKGGEGNSVTLLSRPVKADIFVVWSHLDVMSNTPAENMRAVLGRIVKQTINIDEKRQKVDLLIFYDEWYRNGIKFFSGGAALPDVFVFPITTPDKNNTHPILPRIGNNIFLKSLMKVVGNRDLSDPLVSKHIWYCDIELEKRTNGWVRKMKVFNDFDSKITFTRQGFTIASCKPA